MRILWCRTEDAGQSWIQAWHWESKEYAKRCDIVFWGPGYPNYNKNLSADKILEEVGPVDAIVIGVHYLTDIPKGLKEVGTPKAIFLEDTYSVVRKQLKNIWGKIGLDVVFHRYQVEMDKFYKDFPNIKFVWLPWAVDSTIFTPAHSYEYDVSLMGRTSYRYYDLRRKTLDALERSDLRILRRPHASAFRPGRGAPREGSVYGNEYAKLLGKAKIGVTTGGNPRYTLLKYFEIPAVGSVLLGAKTPSLEALGFEPDTNMVLLDEKQPVKQVKYMLDNFDDVKPIAHAGCRLIRDRHTWSHRAQLFLDTLSELKGA